MKINAQTILYSFTAIVIALICTYAYKEKFRDNKIIIVTGLAQKNFDSDLIVWNGNYSRSSMELKQAYDLLKIDESKIRNYLSAKGINPTEIVFSAVNISKNFNDQYNSEGRSIGRIFAGYSLRQNVKIESKNIDKVEKLSRQITELLQQGIELSSSDPSYFYTKLAELKIDLLAKASKDAKDRAESIAENSGGSLGELKTATMGVFQITGLNSNEDYSYGGAFNTTSKVKTASITLKTTFQVN